jgi:hypothetical protein
VSVRERGILLTNFTPAINQLPLKSVSDNKNVTALTSRLDDNGEEGKNKTWITTSSAYNDPAVFPLKTLSVKETLPLKKQ